MNPIYFSKALLLSPTSLLQLFSNFINRKMSQQLVGQGGQGRRDGRGGLRVCNHITYTPKVYKSPITEIEYNTFNTGASKHAALFTKSRKNTSNYLQCSSLDEGFLVAQIVCTGQAQIIDMHMGVDPGDANAVIVRME